jgi:hypothetical protein
LPLSSVPVPAANSPSQALVAPSQRLLFGADFLGGLLQSFQIGLDGSLAPNPPQPVDAAAFEGSSAPRLPLGLAAHPNRPVLYVGLVTISKLAVYSYDAFGHLHFERAVADSGNGVCWVRTNADGSRLYASNTGDSTISVYDSTDPLNPVEIQRFPLAGVGSSFQLEFDPRGDFLYVVTQRATASTPLGQGNNLHVLQVNANGSFPSRRHRLRGSCPPARDHRDWRRSERRGAWRPDRVTTRHSVARHAFASPRQSPRHARRTT